MSERTCSLEGCDKRHEARGYCPAHYRRWQLYGDPLGSKVREYKTRPRCSVEGCDRPHQGHSFCEMHYWRWKRHGDPRIGRQSFIADPRLCVHCGDEYQPKRARQRFCGRRCATLFRQTDEYKTLARQNSKRCTKCGEVKRLDEYYPTKRGTTGTSPWCKGCHAALSARINARPEMKLRRKDRDLRKKYGLSLDAFQQMLSRQEHRCLICGCRDGEEGRQLVVDHCHKTGAVRGLLCGLCNSAIGYFEEDTDRMFKAIAYLGGVHEDSRIPG